MISNNSFFLCQSILIRLKIFTLLVQNFILFTRISKHRDLLVESIKANTQLGKFIPFHSPTQLHDCVVVFERVTLFSKLFVILILANQTGVLEFAIGSQIEFELLVMQSLLVIVDVVGTGQDKIWGYETGSAFINFMIFGMFE